MEFCGVHPNNWIMDLERIISYVYDVEDHRCDVGSYSSHTYLNAQEILDDCFTFIQDAYDPTSDLFDDAEPCICGHHIKIIMLSISGYVANPQGFGIHRHIMFDIYNHEMTHAQMMQYFIVNQNGVQRIMDLFN